jgi:hypothetical protein
MRASYYYLCALHAYMDALTVLALLGINCRQP